MELGVHIPNFTWPGGEAELAPMLVRIAETAESAGASRLSVMDHLWQIKNLGPPEHAMLEAYTTLGFLAGHTKRLLLHTLVTGVVYRAPGLLAKQISTLDVLSGGRAILGIGAAWNEEEARGLGLDFPLTGERFERLEEALQICLQMWSGSEEPYEGKHYHLGRTLNSPQNISRPRPRIMIGGNGERKTLRLVARYADACNMFGDITELQHKLDVLRAHCETEGRDFATIEKTTMLPTPISSATDPGPVLERIRELHEIGIGAIYVRLADSEPLAPFDVIANHLVPELSNW